MDIIKASDDLDCIKASGRIRLVTKDKDGNIVDEINEPNNILLQIRQPIIRLLGGVMTPNEDLPFINAIGFGSDDTPPTITDKDLITPVNNSRRLLATAPTFSTDGLTATFCVLFDLVEPDIDGKDIKEACLYTKDGVAVARTVIGSYSKAAGMFFEFYWTIGYSA